MNKAEFLRTLETSLADFKEEERKDILYDYEEHFRIGEEAGKGDEQLIEELGDPEKIADQYRLSAEPEIKDVKYTAINEERPLIVPIITVISLLLFNLIFIVGPYIGVAAAILGLFAAAFGITVGGVCMFLGVILLPVFPQFINIPTGASVFAILFFGIGTTALGLLFLIGMCYVGRYFYKGTIKYVKWNVKIIKG